MRFSCRALSSEVEDEDDDESRGERTSEEERVEYVISAGAIDCATVL